jgi:hypothetical protein
MFPFRWVPVTFPTRGYGDGKGWQCRRCKFIAVAAPALHERVCFDGG